MSEAAAGEKAADAKPKPTAPGDPVLSAKAAILIDDTTKTTLIKHDVSLERKIDVVLFVWFNKITCSL